MYAIIQDGGKQYTVKPSLSVDFEKKQVPSGNTVEFTEVLLFSDKGETEIGQPFVKNVKVIGTVEEEEVKAKKIIAFKFKRRKDYRRKIGYRHKYTRIRIQKIVKEA